MSARSADGLPESGRIDTSEHSDPAWHIHEVAKDFELIDAWRLPADGGYDQFSELIELFLSIDFGNDEGSKATSFLFAARLKLGEIFGWDEGEALPIPGCTETSLRDRLSPELLKSAEEFDNALAQPADSTEDDGGPGFAMVYQTETESVLELSNSTVHAAVHLAWVEAEDQADDRYFGRMGIYVKNRGGLGRFYMPAIAPFRHYIVYPALMRRIGTAWQERDSGTAPA